MPFPRRKRRACLECHKSKTRCSLSSPCSRCRTRKLTCEYVHNLLNRYDNSSQSQDHLGSTSSAIVNSDHDLTIFTGNTLESSMFDEMINGDISGSIAPRAEPELAFSPFLGELVAPRVENLSQQMMIPSDITSKDVYIDNYCQPTAGLAGDASQFSWLNSQTHDECGPSLDTETSQPKLPVSTKWQRIETELTKKTLVGQLLTYPKRMNSNHLPPFIFAPCKQGDGCGSNGNHQCLSRPLAHCCAVVTMAENMIMSNVGFIWTIVENEVRRIRQELFSQNCYGVLESLQACAIYVLLYACYVKPFQVGSIISVITAIQDISRRLHTVYNFQAQLSTDKSIFRQEWILRESTRRTVCVLYGIEFLLDAFSQDPNHKKCQFFKHVPLPCTRDLWESVSDSKWTRRYENSLLQQQGYDTLSIGTIQSSLFLLRGRSLDIESRQDAALEAISHWCEGADELGTLVWMAIMLEIR